MSKNEKQLKRQGLKTKPWKSLKQRDLEKKSYEEVENLKAEILKIKEDIDHLWGAIEEDRAGDTLLEKESEDSAMVICNLKERFEKMEETLVYVQEELRDEKKKRKNLGCTVILCSGIALSFVAYRFFGDWATGVVFMGTIVGAAVYSTR